MQASSIVNKWKYSCTWNALGCNIAWESADFLLPQDSIIIFSKISPSCVEQGVYSLLSCDGTCDTAAHPSDNTVRSMRAPAVRIGIDPSSIPRKHQKIFQGKSQRLHNSSARPYGWFNLCSRIFSHSSNTLHWILNTQRTVGFVSRKSQPSLYFHKKSLLMTIYTKWYEEYISQWNSSNPKSFQICHIILESLDILRAVYVKFCTVDIVL